MTTDYVSLETAKLLREVGFNDSDSKVLAKPIWVEEDISPIYCPHLYDVAKWLREVHKINAVVAQIRISRECKFEWVYYLNYLENLKCEGAYVSFFATYEQALDIAIQEACKLIKNK